MADFIKATESANLKNKTGLSVKINQTDIALFRFKGKVYAFKDRCPHQGAPLSDGYVKEDCVVCIYHGWRFKISDGSFINNPTLKLKQYAVEEKNGEIFVKWEI